MREYTSNDPVFSESISVTETSDPAHADNINRAPMQIFQNTLCNRKAIEEVEKRAGSTPEYSEDENEVYKIGVYRLHNGVLYRCIKDTSGEWDPECWEKTDALGEIEGIKNPEFDDSGVVESIKSFPDFLETFVSEMGLFTFMRNLKAGFQFVLHRGQVVDNCETEAEDLPLSARQGKVLMEMSGKLGSDFIQMFRAFTEPITVVIPASGWSDAAPFTNRVEIEGMHKEDNVDVTFIPAEGATNEENIAAWDGYVNINYTTTEDGAMVFHAFETKPEVDVTVAVKGMVRWEEEPEVPEVPDTPDTPEGSTDPGNTDTPESTDIPENQDSVEGG